MSVLPSTSMVRGEVATICALAIFPAGKQLSMVIPWESWMKDLLGCQEVSLVSPRCYPDCILLLLSLLIY